MSRPSPTDRRGPTGRGVDAGGQGTEPDRPPARHLADRGTAGQMA